MASTASACARPSACPTGARRDHARRPRHAHLTVRLESEDKSLIKSCATRSSLTVSDWIRKAVIEEAKRQAGGQQAEQQVESSGAGV